MLELEGSRPGAAGAGSIDQSGEAVAVARKEQAEQAGQTEPGEADDSGQIQELESAAASAIERIAELEKELAKATVSYELERQLVEAGVLDLETATVLAERRLSDGGATVEGVVADLAATKSFLFRSGKPRAGGSAVSGGPAEVRDSLSRLAEEAMQTGDRRAVLRYLKRRRG